MAITPQRRSKTLREARGFTLLIAMIFVSVVLAFAATIGALGYKQSVLASNAIQSQYAFYAADTGLECALYYDEGSSTSPMSYDNYNAAALPQISCDGSAAVAPTATCYNSPACSSQVVYQYELPLDDNSRCADLSFYESETNTYLFAQGYNVSCATVTAGSGRIVARGLEAQN